MNDVTKIGSASAAQQAIERAKKEIAEENIAKGVAKLKTKYRELENAKVVLANIQREIDDLEVAILQGNV